MQDKTKYLKERYCQEVLGVRWEDNVKIVPKLGWWNVEWINLVQDNDQWKALVNKY